MATPRKAIPGRPGPPKGTGGRPRVVSQGPPLQVKLSDAAEEALVRGTAVHGTYSEAVRVALVAAYPAPGKEEAP